MPFPWRRTVSGAWEGQKGANEINEGKIKSSCLLRIRGMFDSFKSAEARLAEYVLHNQETAVNLTIDELATKSQTSYATVARFCKKLGYDGYKDFKNSLIQDVVNRQSCEALEEDLNINLHESLEDICQSVYRFFIRSLEESLSILDYAIIEQAVNQLIAAKTICFIGAGTSGISARYAYSRFFRIGLSCVFEADAALYRMRVATLRPGDLLFAISSSGRSSDIVNCAITAQKNGVTVISLSDFAVSPLTKNSDINLFTTPRNASLFQNIDMPLVVSQITVIDALYSCCCAKFPQEAAQIYQSTRLLQKEEKLKI